MNKSYPHNYLSYPFYLHYYCYFLRCFHFPQKRCFLFCYHLPFFFHLCLACLVAASSSSWPSDSETRPEQLLRLNPFPFPMLPVPRNQISNITRPRRSKTLKHLLSFKKSISLIFTFLHGLGLTSKDALNCLRCAAVKIVRGRFGPLLPSRCLPVLSTTKSSVIPFG